MREGIRKTIVIKPLLKGLSDLEVRIFNNLERHEGEAYPKPLVLLLVNV